MKIGANRVNLGLPKARAVTSAQRGPPLTPPSDGRERSLAGLLRRSFPSETVDLMRRLGAEAEAVGFELFVVGGFVRDLLLGVASLDLDLVVEGDGLSFANRIARTRGGRCVVFPRFGTARVVLKGGIRLDVATARTERYERPGALPDVARSTIDLDLYRRDFTINSMALRLAPRAFGRLVDPFGGRADLAHGLVRTLHRDSFVDDPTRMLRAVRLEQRYGFRMERGTEQLLRQTANAALFRKVSPQRLREELVLVAKELAQEKAFCRLDELDLLRALHPGLALNDQRRQLLSRIRACLQWYRRQHIRGEPEDWVVYLQVLLVGLHADRRRRVAERLRLHKRVTLVADQVAAKGKRLLRQLAGWEHPLPSRAYFALEPLRLESTLLLLAMAGKEGASATLRKYLSAWHHVRPSVTGEDLAAMGVPSGPAHGLILRRVLASTLDGRTATRYQQLKLAALLAKRQERAHGRGGSTPR
jgi:tRNA nucleotidyltransferase (CCA-adding enzyme)